MMDVFGLLLPAAVFVGGCSGDKADTGPDVPVVTGPAMTHVAPTGSFHGGDILSLSVEASDPDLSLVHI